MAHREAPIGIVKAFFIFMMPLVFVFEKEVFIDLPLFIPQHAYFFFSILAIPFLVNGIQKRNLQISKNFIIMLFCIIINFIVVALIDTREAYKNDLISAVFRASYIFLVMWIFYISIVNFRSFNVYLMGLKIAFYIVLSIYLIQLFVILGISRFESLNNDLASIYEARWLPHKVMREIHLYYIDGSYVNTQFRINGLSKEASTFCAGLALVFLPVFMPLAVKKVRGINQSEYALYTILIIIMLFTAQTSTGLALGAAALGLLYWTSEGKILTRVLGFVVLFVVALVGIPLIMDSDNFLKIMDLTNISTRTRYGTVYAGINAIIQFPILGRGDVFYYSVFSNIPSWAKNRELDAYFTEESIRVFFLPVSIYGEYGLIVFGIISSYFIRLWRFSRSAGRKNRVENLSVWFFLAFMVIASLSTSSYLHPFYFLSFGMSYAMFKNGGQIFSDRVRKG